MRTRTSPLLLLVAAGAGMTKVQQQFFPTAARPELLAELRMREGASFAATEQQVKRLEAILAQDPDVEYFTAYTGAGTPIFYLSIQAELPNPGFAQVVIKTAGIEQRERVRALAPEVRFLVLDEATASLDPITQADVWRALQSLCAERGTGILAISHDEALLGHVAARTVHLPIRHFR